MARVFISYRRADSRTISGRIHDRLVQAFGDANIFKDVDDIEMGADFRRAIHDAIANCNIVLVIIGPNWVDAKGPAGERRLEQPDDFVREEVQAALQNPDIRVIPVLVHGAAMPTADQLPASLRELAYRNAAIVRDDPDFHRDVDKLIDSIGPVEEDTVGKSSSGTQRREISGTVGIGRRRSCQFNVALILALVVFPVMALVVVFGGAAVLFNQQGTGSQEAAAAVQPTDDDAGSDSATLISPASITRAPTTPAPSATHTAAPTETPTPRPTATATPEPCEVTPRESFPGVTIRIRPDVAAVRMRVLREGERAKAVARTAGREGFFWWELEGGGWISDGFVWERGNCEDVPVVEP